MRKLIALLLTLCVGIAPALANESVVPPGNWNKVDSLAPGTPILVSLKSGVKWEGALQGTDASSVRIAAGGKETAFQKDSVSEVHLASDQAHMKGNIAFGAILGIVGGAIVAGSLARSSNSGGAAGGAFCGMLAGGIVVGYALGKHSEGKALIYQSADRTQSK